MIQCLTPNSTDPSFGQFLLEILLWMLWIIVIIIIMGTLGDTRLGYYLMNQQFYSQQMETAWLTNK